MKIFNRSAISAEPIIVAFLVSTFFAPFFGHATTIEKTVICDQPLCVVDLQPIGTTSYDQNMQEITFIRSSSTAVSAYMVGFQPKSNIPSKGRGLQHGNINWHDYIKICRDITCSKVWGDLHDGQTTTRTNEQNITVYNSTFYVKFNPIPSSNNDAYNLKLNVYPLLSIQGSRETKQNSLGLKSTFNLGAESSRFPSISPTTLTPSVSPSSLSPTVQPSITPSVSWRTLQPNEPLIFEYTGYPQYVYIPDEPWAKQVFLYMWGAGGHSTLWGDQFGGSGAYVEGQLNVTGGSVLKVIVGGSDGYGGGGPIYEFSWGEPGRGGNGGGRTALQYMDEDMVTAGGGGGAGSCSVWGGSATAYSNGQIQQVSYPGGTDLWYEFPCSDSAGTSCYNDWAGGGGSTSRGKRYIHACIHTNAQAQVQVQVQALAHEYCQIQSDSIVRL